MTVVENHKRGTESHRDLSALAMTLAQNNYEGTRAFRSHSSPNQIYFVSSPTSPMSIQFKIPIQGSIESQECSTQPDLEESVLAHRFTYRLPFGTTYTSEEFDDMLKKVAQEIRNLSPEQVITYLRNKFEK